MIICAAVKFQIEGLSHETVVPCRRHGDAFKVLQDLNYQPKQKYKELDQGFITHTGEFLGREAAFEHAIICGQLSVTQQKYCRSNKLFSEDLY